ncbi:hypothetical protein DFR55_11635 [Herbinix hemicellulosilytica]|uniref:Secreted protein n=1 Tax=Herbinix hemicellulosilytica TaxID=1564487 RepID=A0A0H5ST22_HERHM|nr:hypothetical protein [Herbinix hemicellulosilytica]RBP58001.1 hypothetical protein DFR55_11635 [Herbinix hemicellulosilytica]CRZ33448.1 hypothetical protein HHT355_0236 [Herbinix hemicellulosilytica]
MKKVISLILTVIIVLSSTSFVFAAEKDSDNRSRFNSVSGTVKEIKKSETDEDALYVLLETGKDSEAYLIINKETCFINDEEIFIGSKVTGFYDADAMMIMIYPPQYAAIAVWVSNEEQNIKVDLFDKNLVSADNTLKLIMDKDTKIVTKDGKEFKDDLANRKLAVFYRSATKSIPAQTRPDKIVVLSEPIIPDEDKNSYFGSFKGTVTDIEILKEDKNIKRITLTDKDGLEAKFTITDDTYLTNNEKIAIGSVVTGYYDAKVFRIMIYPPQYEAVVLNIERPDYKVKADYFDNKLISADKSLKLNIGNDTEIIYMDGAKYSGKPVNSNLAVIYDKVNESMPAQTEPVKVIVLEKSKSNDKTESKNDSLKAKLDEWKKLTEELFKNLDKLSDFKENLFKFISELIYKHGNPLSDVLKILGRN